MILGFQQSASALKTQNTSGVGCLLSQRHTLLFYFFGQVHFESFIVTTGGPQEAVQYHSYLVKSYTAGTFGLMLYSEQRSDFMAFKVVEAEMIFLSLLISYTL